MITVEATSREFQTYLDITALKTHTTDPGYVIVIILRTRMSLQSGYLVSRVAFPSACY